MKIKEETDDTIVLADSPKESIEGLLFSVIIALGSIVAIIKLGVDNSTIGMAFMGMAGIVITSYNLYRNESIIIA